MPTVRTFVAVDLPSPVREALGRCQERLGAAQRPYVKWVDPKGIHLTLKFLGNVEESLLPRLAAALAAAVTGLNPFKVQAGGLGAFPSSRNPRVLWVGLAGDLEALLALHRSVEEALVPRGFLHEERPFTPHLTLGRMREGAGPGEKQQLGRALAEVDVGGPWDIPVEEVHVMKSELARSGARYTSLYTLPLQKDE